MLSESARRVRCPSHLRLGDAEMGKKRPWNPLHHPSQTVITERADIESLILCLLRTDIQLFTKSDIPDSALDADICNRGCKRLQPGMQTFASRKSTVHPARKSPSLTPIFMSIGAHGRVIWMAILDLKGRPKTSSRGFGGRKTTPNGCIFCTKRA